MTGLIVFAHGSPVESANAGVRALTAEVARRSRFDVVETAFLDSAPPDLSTAVAALAGRGVTRIVIVPFFLTLGLHLKRDLPGIVERLRGIHQGVSIGVTPPLEGHEALVQIVLERAADGEKESAIEGQTG